MLPKLTSLQKNKHVLRSSSLKLFISCINVCIMQLLVISLVFVVLMCTIFLRFFLNYFYMAIFSIKTTTTKTTKFLQGISSGCWLVLVAENRMCALFSHVLGQCGYLEVCVIIPHSSALRMVPVWLQLPPSAASLLTPLSSCYMLMEAQLRQRLSHSCSVRQYWRSLHSGAVSTLPVPYQQIQSQCI